MEISTFGLHQGLTFLAVSTGVMVIFVGAFLTKLLFDLSKLTKNIDETTTVVKTELEPTLKELNKAIKSINSIAEHADKQVDSISKIIEGVFGAGTAAIYRAKALSGGFVKGLVKGIATVVKFFYKK